MMKERLFAYKETLKNFVSLTSGVDFSSRKVERRSDDTAVFSVACLLEHTLPGYSMTDRSGGW